MTYDSWKTTEPEPDYVPDEEPPCEVEDGSFDERAEFIESILGPMPASSDGPERVMLSYVESAIATADRLGLHATITIRITSPNGTVVDVTKQSEMARRGGS